MQENGGAVTKYDSNNKWVEFYGNEEHWVKEYPGCRISISCFFGERCGQLSSEIRESDFKECTVECQRLKFGISLKTSDVAVLKEVLEKKVLKN